MKAFIGILLLLLADITTVAAQTDTTTNSRQQAIELDSILIIAHFRFNRIKQLPAEQGTFIFSGKKTEVIQLLHAPIDISNKTGRQLFARIPGVFVYDMDGSGNQVNIATRGLDPHRGWDFNMRKDGIITNSDMYGYPASHYSMPMESVERIELVRGTGSLQYGAQFGGMVNYVTKQGDTSRAIGFESINTVGSYNLLSTYNAVGGRKGKFSYYAYAHQKTRDGYRDNEQTNAQAYYVGVTYQPTTSLSIRAEWGRSTYRYRLPGALTDSMFNADPTQATRSRNYYSPDIHIPSVNLNWQLGSTTKLQLISSAVLGNRSSVMFDKPTDIRDSINSSTLQYNHRQVDIDQYHSYTTEIRILQELFRVGKQTSTLVAGVQYMNNDLHRRQLGKGTTGSDYDLTLVDPAWGRDVHLKTNNLALFAEGKFQLLHNFSLNAGVRMESGQTDLTGKIIYYQDQKVPVQIKHRFPLFGAGFSYKPFNVVEMYGGFAQAYHPMLFKDLIPSSTFERVDSSIRDARGYNAELGVRGSWSILRWDISLFVLRMTDRFGTLARTDDLGNLYTYRTNTGHSFTKGLEMFVQADWRIGAGAGISLFTSTAYMQARYTKGMIRSGNTNKDITGNKVESAPDFISRNGLIFRYRILELSALLSYTGESFADALNTVQPPKATGAVGLVPGYALLDLNASIRINASIEARINLNNITNKQYFTKRPSFYPGPGIWPSDGRNGTLTIIVTL